LYPVGNATGLLLENEGMKNFGLSRIRVSADGESRGTG